MIIENHDIAGCIDFVTAGVDSVWRITEDNLSRNR